MRNLYISLFAGAILLGSVATATAQKFCQNEPAFVLKSKTLIDTVQTANLSETYSANYRIQASDSSIIGYADRNVSVKAAATGIILPQQIESSFAPLVGLRIDLSIAPPASIPNNFYELAKYGQISLQYMPANMDNFGAEGQALHIEHHLLFYSFGVSSDINGDGMLIASVGISHYQTGNDWQPFVNAPFAKIRFQSSQKSLFYAYSEVEGTMTASSFLSGFAGVGVNLSTSAKIIAGFHHTEFVIPSEQTVLQINGFQGMLTFGI